MVYFLTTFLEELFDFLQVVLYIVLKTVLDILCLPFLPFVYLFEWLSERRVRKTFKSILITGASSGIGEGLALTLASSGVKLVLTGRNKSRLESVAEECRKKSATVITYLVDVTDKEGMAQLIQSEDTDRPLDLVVANAGLSYGVINDKGSLKETTGPVCDVNVNGVLNTVFPAMDRMVARRNGQIAVVSSVGGWVSYGEHTDYHMSKFAVRGFAEGLRPLLSPFNVGVSAICPGFVETRIIIPLKQRNISLPFIMSAQKASTYMLSGLERNVGIIAFPFPMYFLTVWLAGVPPFLRSVIQRYGAKVAPFNELDRILGKGKSKSS